MVEESRTLINYKVIMSREVNLTVEIILLTTEQMNKTITLTNKHNKQRQTRAKNKKGREHIGVKE